ncbi:hypothetical protein ACFWUP_09950 [Nocardia sp. NPDC058658]|uniref:hypothetical protein n=1 Tax=Nocardia sp. NPDC058658 TaxID=3346580 RepID=UPI003662D7EC
MTTFLAIAVAVAAGLAVYHFAPKEGELPFWPFQYLPHDRAFGTYDDERLYRDLDAMRARELDAVQLPDTGLQNGPNDTQPGSLAA